ncbi:hypothetical protein K438DRAFT_1757883 [Mycena galopus ATCC 62051]|nr:hypothetical protein K438DRAFT_1757883 [Mycena galopus ATCC 62051]
MSPVLFAVGVSSPPLLPITRFTVPETSDQDEQKCDYHPEASYRKLKDLWSSFPWASLYILTEFESEGPKNAPDNDIQGGKGRRAAWPTTTLDWMGAVMQLCLFMWLRFYRGVWGDLGLDDMDESRDGVFYLLGATPENSRARRAQFGRAVARMKTKAYRSRECTKTKNRREGRMHKMRCLEEKRAIEVSVWIRNYRLLRIVFATQEMTNRLREKCLASPWTVLAKLLLSGNAESTSCYTEPSLVSGVYRVAAVEVVAEVKQAGAGLQRISGGEDIWGFSIAVVIEKV